MKVRSSLKSLKNRHRTTPPETEPKRDLPAPFPLFEGGPQVQIIPENDAEDQDEQDEESSASEGSEIEGEDIKPRR